MKGKEGSYRLVKVVPHRVSQCADGIVQDEQVFVLVLPKGKNQCVQYEAEVGNQLCAGLFLQGGKGAGARGGE